MRRWPIGVATLVLSLATMVGAGPADAQTTGGDLCDVFGGLLGEDGQTQCEEQGGDQIPVSDVTTPTCEALDEVLTGVEDGGGEALADPIRQLVTDLGVCVFATQPEEPPPPPTTSPTTEAPAPAPTLPVTGEAPGPGGAPLGAVGVAGIALAAAVGALGRRLRSA